MPNKAHITLMASYNRDMNKAIYHAATQLSDRQLREDRGAFFASVLGMLNHNLVGDIIWLKRFAAYFFSLSSLDYVRVLDRPAALNSQLLLILPS